MRDNSELRHAWPMPQDPDQLEALQARAHKLAGSASLVAADPIYDGAKAIEAHQDITTPEGQQALEALLLRLSESFLSVEQALKAPDLTELLLSKPEAVAGDDGQGTSELSQTKLTEALQALRLKKFQAIALVETLEAQLAGHISDEKREALKTALSKLD